MAKQVFNITYRISDLSVMEQDIQKISRGFLDCEKLTKNKLNSSQCFSELAVTLEDAIRDFKSSSPSTSRRNRVKYATMFMTMVVFQAHIALIAKNSPLPYKTNLNKRYGFIFEKINAHLNQFEFRSEDWRISASQVTPVTICEIHVIMWIEFQGACEKRWRRSVDEEENFGLGTSYDNESLIDRKVERIGNPNPHKMKYRATVYDKFASYQVFQEDALVDSSSRGVGIFELFKKGNSRRLKYNEGIANEMKRFNEDLVTLVRGIVESTNRILLS